MFQSEFSVWTGPITFLLHIWLQSGKFSFFTVLQEGGVMFAASQGEVGWCHEMGEGYLW